MADERLESDKRFARNLVSFFSPADAAKRLAESASSKLGGTSGMVNAAFGGGLAPTVVNKLNGMVNPAPPPVVPVAPLDKQEIETKPQAPTAPAAVPRPATGGGGGVAGSQMMERDLLGPTQKAALAGYRGAEREYAAKWADPYLQMQAQEEALQRQAVDEQKAVADVQAKAEAERAYELSQRQAQFDDSVKELSNMKIDPDRAVRNSNPLQMAFGTIAAILGGAQSALRGGPNQGLEELNKWIETDINAQKFEFAAKKEGVQQQQTAFAQAMQRFGDMRQAEAIARASLKERFGMEAMALASKTKRADLMDKAAQMQVQLRKSAAEDAQKFIGYGAVGGAGAPKDESAIFDEDKVSGGNLLFNDSKTREKYDETTAAAAQAKTIIDRIKQTHSDLYSTKSLNPLEKVKLVQQLNADKAALTGAIKKAGESSDTDQSRNMGRVGGVLAPNADFRQMDSIAGDLQKAADRVAQQGGAQGINAQRVVDKKSHKVQLRGDIGGKYTAPVDEKLRALATANKYTVSK